MSQSFISNETLSELFMELRCQPTDKVRFKIREIINNDLQAGASYPDEIAEEIIEELGIDTFFIPVIIEALKTLYFQNSAKDNDWFPDNN